MQQARDVAASSVGSLALVPLAQPTAALAIRSDEIDQAVSDVRLQMRSHAWHMRQEEDRRARSILEWQSTGGEEACAEVVRLLPRLGQDFLSMNGVPSFASMSWVRLFFPADMLIPKILAMRRSAEVQAALDAAEEVWLRRHYQIQHCQQTPLGYEPKMTGKAKPKPTCLAAKLCLCGRDGDELWALYLKVISVVRRHMRPALCKEDMKEGNIVIHLMPLNAEQVAKIQDGSADLTSTDPSFVDGNVFAHVSLLYESPLRPTLRFEYKHKTHMCGRSTPRVVVRTKQSNSLPILVAMGGSGLQLT